ncbi:MAG: ATP synthase subunit I [Clostridium sp.]|jgi:hypothetical protein|nr:ATP synthase subunit I [Clostridium sp.]
MTGAVGLRKQHKTFLELALGILFWGLLCQSVGLFVAKDQAYYARSLWFGIVLAWIGSFHMYRSLDKALGRGAAAVKLVARDYMIRYAALLLVLLLAVKTGSMNPLVVFLAYMGLKAAALAQPLIHKLCNRLFREADPPPEPDQGVEQPKPEDGGFREQT